VESREFSRISSLAQALWADPRAAAPVLAEAVAMATLRKLNPEQEVEHVASRLFSEASRAAPMVAPKSPFFRLSPQERFILAGLHQARWGYERLARVLGLNPLQIAEVAWGARLQLSMSPGTQLRVPFPAASVPGMNCPEYHPGRPWTQRFLDEELSLREKSYLQSHAEICLGCRQTLERAREFYHGVGKWVPRLQQSEEAYWQRELGRVQERSWSFQSDETNFTKSLISLFSRWDMRLLLAFALLVWLRA